MNWTMLGSNDGVTWDVLDTRTNEHAWGSPETRTYSCAVATTAYRFFRLNSTDHAATVDGGDARFTEVDELHLVGVPSSTGATPQTITFPAIASHIANDPSFVLTATSDSGLAVAYAVASGPATVSGNTVTLTGAGTVTVEAFQPGNGTYAGATPVGMSFSVTAPVEIGPNDLTSNTSHPPFVASGFNEYNAACGAFQGPGGSDWLSTQLPAWLQIDIGTAKVLGRYLIKGGNAGRTPKTWAMLGSNDGAVWDVLDTRTNEVGWSDGDSRLYTCAVVTTAYRYFRINITAEQGTENIAQINQLALYQGVSPASVAQAITFPAIADHISNDAPFALTATSDSGLPVTYVVASGSATIVGSTVTLNGAGTVTIEARQAGDGTYFAATPVDRSFNVTAAAELGPHDLTSDTSHPPFVVSASSAYGFLPEFHAFDGTSTYWIGVNGGVDWLQIDLGSPQVLGSYAILATSELARMPKDWTMQGSNDGAAWTVLDTRAGQAWTSGETLSFRILPITTAYRYYRLNITANNGDGTYTDIGELSLFQGIIAGGASTAQAITFPVIATHHPADAPFALAATSDSGLTVSYAVNSGPATVVANTVTLTGVTGNVTIQATQSGDSTYLPAAPISRTFAVSNLTPQTITFPPLSDGAANDPPFVLIGTSDSGLALTYLVTAGLATISGNTVTITGVGSVTIEARQPGNGTYAPATPVDRSFTVAAAQRGCIAYDQIKASDRTGNGNQLLTYSPAPASATSPGAPGQVAFDAAGYWYFCYGVNQWGRIGPTGYGNTAASPPSW